MTDAWDMVVGEVGHVHCSISDDAWDGTDGGTGRLPVGMFDTCGLLFWLGTDGGARPYTNPHTAGQVTASASRLHKGEPHIFVHHNFEPGEKVLNYTPDSGDDNWMSVDLGPGCSLCPELYALRHESECGGAFALACWRFEGSEDGERWEMLREHAADGTTREHCVPMLVRAWALDEAAVQGRSFRHFRICRHSGTARNAAGTERLACAGIELCECASYSARDARARPARTRSLAALPSPVCARVYACVLTASARSSYRAVCVCARAVYVCVPVSPQTAWRRAAVSLMAGRVLARCRSRKSQEQWQGWRRRGRWRPSRPPRGLPVAWRD